MRRHYNISKRIKPGVTYGYHMFTWVRLVEATAAAVDIAVFVLSDGQIAGGNFRVFGVKCGRVRNSYLKLMYIRPVMRLPCKRGVT